MNKPAPENLVLYDFVCILKLSHECALVGMFFESLCYTFLSPPKRNWFEENYPVQYRTVVAQTYIISF